MAAEVSELHLYKIRAVQHLYNGEQEDSIVGGFKNC